MTIVTVFALGGAAPARAQDVSLGVVTGFNFATLSIEDDEGQELDPRTGVGIGAHGSLDLSPSFGVTLELLYSQKGTKVVEGDARATFLFNYLEFPVLARYQIPTTAAGTVEPHIAGGFVLSFEVGCRLKGESGGVAVTVGCTEAEVETKSLDLGFMFLGGFDILVGPGALMLDAAYNFGLTNINDVSGEGSLKNRVLYLRAGYKYPLGSI
jgi:hypothetical protein